VNKLERTSLKNNDYKKVEEEGSEALGEKVLRRYESGLGVKYLFLRQNKKIFDFILSANQTDLYSKKLLEIGCGFGDFLFECRGKIGSVYGVDLVFKQIQTAKERLSGNSYVLLADGENLPFQDNIFDFILMKGLVHHLGKPHKVFKEAKRTLVNNGKLIIFEGNPTSRYRKIVLKIADLLKIGHESSLFKHLSSEEMIEILSDSGFSVEHKKGVSGFFAPLGLSGIGNAFLWERLNFIEDFLQDKLPLFMWYNLIVAIADDK